MSQGRAQEKYPNPGRKDLTTTEKKVEFQMGSATRFGKGKKADEHNYFDRLKLLAQLGINP